MANRKKLKTHLAYSLALNMITGYRKPKEPPIIGISKKKKAVLLSACLVIRNWKAFIFWTCFLDSSFGFLSMLAKYFFTWQTGKRFKTVTRKKKTVLLDIRSFVLFPSYCLSCAEVSQQLKTAVQKFGNTALESFIIR